MPKLYTDSSVVYEFEPTVYKVPCSVFSCGSSLLVSCESVLANLHCKLESVPRSE